VGTLVNEWLLGGRKDGPPKVKDSPVAIESHHSQRPNAVAGGIDEIPAIRIGHLTQSTFHIFLAAPARVLARRSMAPAILIN
jgi:hypothetical protein